MTETNPFWWFFSIACYLNRMPGENFIFGVINSYAIYTWSSDLHSSSKTIFCVLLWCRRFRERETRPTLDGNTFKASTFTLWFTLRVAVKQLIICSRWDAHCLEMCSCRKWREICLYTPTQVDFAEPTSTSNQFTSIRLITDRTGL